MNTEELNALAALTFNWTRALDDVWAPSHYHVEGLHAEAAELIQRGIAEAGAGQARPLGVVISGERGVGKTHLLGWTREQVQQAGGYFFLVGNFSGKVFWEEVLGSVVEQLLPLRDGTRDQLGTLLTGLADRAGLEGEPFRAAVTGRIPPSPAAMKVFIAALRRSDPSLGLIVQDTARALILLASPLQEDQDVGYYFLTGEEVDVQDRRRWGINSQRKQPRFLLGELSQLLALTGPTVLAVDQIDALIDELVGVSGDAPPDSRELADMATGLMMLRDLTRRTLTVISALPESWEYVRRYGVDTMADRFRAARQLRNIPTADIGRLMIEKRFAADYARVGFEPPYPTWPILPAAFEDANRYTARALLKRIEAHVSQCLHEREAVELDRLDDGAEASAGLPARPAAGDSRADAELAQLDALFAKLRDGADVRAAVDGGTEDSAVPALLSAGLGAWIRELGADSDHAFVQDPLPGKNPRLHACLRMMLDARTERHRRWSFRAIASGHPRAVQSRLRKALDAAALETDGAGRHLFVLRNAAGWPGGPATEKVAAEFAAKGGVVLPLTPEDLKTLHALGELLAGHHQELNAWLIARQPAHRTGLFEQALGGVGNPMQNDNSKIEDDNSREIHLGLTADRHEPVSADLESLRRHVAVFAGSGSGKTVLLRRIIEECALRGVSSIVLDPNNDLARLGDAWPEAPAQWADGDGERAGEYLASTDVVIWTPGRQGGRPLSFKPLPAFGDVLDDPDEFHAAVNAAVEALAPRLNVHRGTVKADQEKAVLREALEYFGREGGSDLDAFVELLSDLPLDASSLWKASHMGADLAQRLQAVRVNDPLFGGSGETVDPGMLLRPAPGKRARVSVVSLVGLPSLEQRQSFVNQLQMALFSWIKAHPAADRPLGGLFVMDEAQDLAPSGKTTASTESTLRLASQARKYGLGMLFATQSPKALHNRIPGNATT
jgi:Helicase HerA, central domain